MTLEYSRVTLAGPLWTVAEAKANHLRITEAAHDADVQQKLEAAQEWVLAYLGPAADATWTPATAPATIKNAVLNLAAHYYEHRGDTLGATGSDEIAIYNALRHMLQMYRDPALA